MVSLDDFDLTASNNLELQKTLFSFLETYLAAFKSKISENTHHTITPYSEIDKSTDDLKISRILIFSMNPTIFKLIVSVRVTPPSFHSIVNHTSSVFLDFEIIPFQYENDPIPAFLVKKIIEKSVLLTEIKISSKFTNSDFYTSLKNILEICCHHFQFSPKALKTRKNDFNPEVFINSIISEFLSLITP